MSVHPQGKEGRAAWVLAWVIDAAFDSLRGECFTSCPSRSGRPRVLVRLRMYARSVVGGRLICSAIHVATDDALMSEPRAPASRVRVGPKVDCSRKRDAARCVASACAVVL